MKQLSCPNFLFQKSLFRYLSPRSKGNPERLPQVDQMFSENHESEENSITSPISHNNQETDYEVATNTRVLSPEPRNLEESITAQFNLQDYVN